MGSEEAGAAAPAAAHDLCFIVDGTGSMQSFLAALANSLPQVMLDHRKQSRRAVRVQPDPASTSHMAVVWTLTLVLLKPHPMLRRPH